MEEPDAVLAVPNAPSALAGVMAASPDAVGVVRIYVAAGPIGIVPAEGPTLDIDPHPARADGAIGVEPIGEAMRRCVHLNVSACRIYELVWPWAQWAPGTYARVVVRRGVGKVAGGLAKPTVSPDGRLLAYQYVDSAGRNRIGIRDVIDDADVAWVSVSGSREDLEGSNPAWDPSTGDSVERKLWFNRTSEWSDCTDPGRPNGLAALYSAEAVFGPGALYERAVTRHADPLLAPDTFGASPCDLSWPTVNPTRPSQLGAQSAWADLEDLGASGCSGSIKAEGRCPWVDDVGPAPRGIVPSAAVGTVVDPAVADVAGRWRSSLVAPPADASYWPVDFDLARERVGTDPFLGLAHLDWSPSGRTVAAYEQEGAPLDGGPQVSRVLGLAQDGDVFRPSRTRAVHGMGPARTLPLFDARSDAEVAADLGIPTAPNQACGVSVHKYPTFCGQPGDVLDGSDRYLLALVGCAQGPGGAHAWDRVMLIDLQDPEAPAYHDLTSIVEDFEHVPRNSYGGVMGDCGPWHAGPDAVVGPQAPTAHDAWVAMVGRRQGCVSNSVDLRPPVQGDPLGYRRTRPSK